MENANGFEMQLEAGNPAEYISRRVETENFPDAQHQGIGHVPGDGAYYSDGKLKQQSTRKPRQNLGGRVKSYRICCKDALKALAVALCLGVFLLVPDTLTAQAPLTPEQSQRAEKIAAAVARAEAGDVRAQVALGVMYENGIDFPRDYSQALAWYQKAAAQGNHEAENNLGLMYRDGLGVQRDYAQALVWYQKAAAQGDANAESNIGLMYYKGLGVQQDPAQAIGWFQRAAAKGNAVAECNLGVIYRNGQGVQQDYVQAVAWYQKAAAHGNVRAETDLGGMYETGSGVQKDYAQAIAWYQKAAEAGYPQAEANLGWMYQNGLGIPVNEAQAMSWYLKAAALGNARAESNLGAMYQNGVGVQQDYAQAVSWYQKAAAQGNAEAESNLGQMYENGLGLKKDTAQAIAWYQKAVAQGNSLAKKNLDALNQQIANPQVARAGGGGPLPAQNTPARSTLAGTGQQVTPAPCTPIDKINSQYPPPDLYRMVGQCIQDNDYPSAVALFVLAGMDTRFDVSRVGDKTVGDTGNLLIMKTFESMPAPAKKKFDIAIHTVSTQKSVTEYLCGWVRQVGPPAYYPEYMILHGMHAAIAGRTKAPLQEELLPVADPSGSWKTIGANYVHCALAEQSVSVQNPQAADRYRGTIEQAIAATPAPPAPGTVMPTNSSSSLSKGNGATPDQPVPTYGSLTFNSEGADFYVAQDGKFAPASVVDGTIVIHLHPQSFQIGYNGEQLNVCLAQSPFPEVRADPSGYRASCLSGPFTGAREPNSDTLLVYGGQKWSDGNTELSDATSRKTSPMKGFRSAYQVNQLQFIEARDLTLSHFQGTLYGYIVVYKQHERSNRDIVPIHLIVE